MRRITELDYLRAALVLLAAIAQTLFAFLPEILDWSVSISTRAREYETVLSPAGPAFAIWGPLFLGCLGFAIFHAFPAQLRDPLTARVGWLAFASFAGNATWALHQPIFGPGFVSFAILLAIAAPLLAAIRIVNKARPVPPGRLIAFAPLFALAGWITIAAAAGFSLALNFNDVNPLGLAETTGALLLLAGWALLALPLTWGNRSIIFAGPIAWGLFWIHAANRTRGEDVLATGAIALAVLIVVAALAGKLAARRAPSV